MLDVGAGDCPCLPLLVIPTFVVAVVSLPPFDGLQDGVLLAASWRPIAGSTAVSSTVAAASVAAAAAAASLAALRAPFGGMVAGVRAGGGRRGSGSGTVVVAQNRPKKSPVIPHVSQIQEASESCHSSLS